MSKKKTDLMTPLVPPGGTLKTHVMLPPGHAADQNSLVATKDAVGKFSVISQTQETFGGGIKYEVEVKNISSSEVRYTADFEYEPVS